MFFFLIYSSHASTLVGLIGWSGSAGAVERERRGKGAVDACGFDMVIYSSSETTLHFDGVCIKLHTG